MKFVEKYKEEIELFDKLLDSDIFADIVILAAVGLLCDELYDKTVRTKMFETIDECRKYLLNKEVKY